MKSELERQSKRVDRLIHKILERGKEMAKNPCGKMRKLNDPYEVWESFDGSWQWNVLKKNQVKDDKPYASWFCMVKSPFVPDGEMGDVYVSEIKDHAIRVR
jgi:hypothetical protein